MRQVGEILGGVVKRLGKREGPLAWLQGTWPRLVGAAVAVHTQPLRCEDRVLTIQTPGGEWREALETMKEELRLRVNEGWGGSLVSRIELTDPPRKRARYETDNNHTPFIRRGAAHPSAHKPPVGGPRK